MMNRAFKSIAIFALLITSNIALQAQEDKSRAVDNPEEAMAFIETLARKTEEVWDNSTLTASERASGFRNLFQEATDTRVIALAMLGSQYRRITPQQRKDYITAITGYVISEFDRRMTQFGYEKLEMVGTTPAPGKRGHLYVHTEVIRDEGDPILIDWRVRKKNGVLQIINLKVQGINLVITTRELFRSRIKAVGIEGLIAELREDSTMEVATAAQ